MRLGIFGGSFDPVHYGHLWLAETVRERCQLDQVLFIPAGIPPHKQEKKLTPAIVRFEMLQLAIAGNERFAIDRFEIDRNEVSYTVQTLRSLQKRYRSATLFLLVGADMLADLPRWREAANVCEMAIPVAVRRLGEPKPDYAPLAELVSPERLQEFERHQVEMPGIELSSSRIRRLAHDGWSIRYQVPAAVEQYIKSNKLYED